jgi:hypothetical protein
MDHSCGHGKELIVLVHKQRSVLHSVITCNKRLGLHCTAVRFGVWILTFSNQTSYIFHLLYCLSYKYICYILQFISYHLSTMISFQIYSSYVIHSLCRWLRVMAETLTRNTFKLRIPLRPKCDMRPFGLYKQLVVLIFYRRFGTTYRSQLTSLTLEDGTNRLFRNLCN